MIARPLPPAPRTSAVVDPRIGDLGPALLALEDGAVFPGVAFGAGVAAGGDLVVNTSQTGYQEVCTDPSYAGQVVVMTYPLIGNYGRLVADDDERRLDHHGEALAEPGLERGLALLELVGRRLGRGERQLPDDHTRDRDGGFPHVFATA